MSGTYKRLSEDERGAGDAYLDSRDDALPSNTAIQSAEIEKAPASSGYDSYRTSGEWPRSFKSLTQEDHQSSTFRAFINITKCFVGAASLELPWAFMQAGWVFGFLGLLFLALISYYTLWQLARCGHLCVHLDPSNQAPTYPEIGKMAFGRIGMFLTYFGILFAVLGAVGSYFVFIGTTLSSLLCPFSPVLTPTVMTLLTLPVIVLLSWIRAYRFLAPTSIFGVLALLLAVILVLVDGFMNYSIQPIETYPPIQVATIPLYLGNAAFLYLIHIVVLPAEQSMQKRKQFSRAVGASVITVTIVNVVFALLAYFLFGALTQGNVIENLVPGVRKIIVKVALTIDLLATSVLFLLPMFELFERAIWDESRDFGKIKVEILRNVLRSVIVAAACGIALLIPCFSLVTGLSGGLGPTMLGLILPPAFFLRLSWLRGRFKRMNRKKIFEICACVVILFSGFCIFFLSTGFTIEKVIVQGCGSNTTESYCDLRTYA